jgi:hypothetical protein
VVEIKIKKKDSYVYEALNKKIMFMKHFFNIMLMEAGHKNPVLQQKVKALLDFSYKSFPWTVPLSSTLHMRQTSSTMQIM